MDIPRNRWIAFAVTVGALFSALQLCFSVSMPPFRSITSFFLFATSYFGIERFYSAVLDILIIVCKRRSPEGKALP
jgi:hypothetical protein